MANKYWVGGTGSTNDTTHWSTTSGGAGGAGVPGISDAVFYDANSGTGTVTGSGINNGSMSVTATQALTFTGGFRCYGACTLPSGGSTDFTNAGLAVFGAFTPNGKTIGSFVTTANQTLTENWNILGNMDVQGSKTVTLNGFTITVGTLNLAASQSRTFAMETSSSIIVTGNSCDLGISKTTFTGTGKISMTSASAKTFTGTGTFPITLEQAGAGALTIAGTSTFDTISNSVQPTTITFTSGTTQTVTNFNVSGISGNLVTINATSTGAATLSKSSGTVSVQYCNISKSTATGGAIWEAFMSNGNVNGGGNTGWDFGATGNGLFFGSNF